MAAPNLMGSTPELSVLHCVNVGYKSNDLLQQPGLEHASAGMSYQRPAGAARQGIKEWVNTENGLETKKYTRAN